jgi:acetoacetyl-CoA synthetase
VSLFIHIPAFLTIMAVADVLWTHPDPTSTPMWHFLQRVNTKYDLQLKDYQGLYQWSVDQIGPFWEETWEFVGIKASVGYEQVS